MNERIKQVRLSLNLSQTEFGKRVGLTQNYIWMIEKGSRVPSERAIASICREFNVNEEWLETGNGEMLNKVSDTEKLATFIGDISLNKSDEFKRRMVCILADLDDDDWKLLEKLAEKIVASRKKEETL